MSTLCPAFFWNQPEIALPERSGRTKIFVFLYNLTFLLRLVYCALFPEVARPLWSRAVLCSFRGYLKIGSNTFLDCFFCYFFIPNSDLMAFLANSEKTQNFHFGSPHSSNRISSLVGIQCTFAYNGKVNADDDPLGGSNQFLLLIGAAVAAIVGFYNHVEYEKKMIEKLVLTSKILLRPFWSY